MNREQWRGFRFFKSDGRAGKRAGLTDPGEKGQAQGSAGCSGTSALPRGREVGLGPPSLELCGAIIFVSSYCAECFISFIHCVPERFLALGGTAFELLILVLSTVRKIKQGNGVSEKGITFGSDCASPGTANARAWKKVHSPSATWVSLGGESGVGGS